LKNKKCPSCNIDYSFISEKHRLGCSFCYFAFRKEMLYVFEYKQDNNYKHVGKIPKKYDNPVVLFVNDLIDEKIKNENVKKDLKDKMQINASIGEQL